MTHEFTYSNGVIQKKRLIKHSDYLKVKLLPETTPEEIEEKETVLKSITGGHEWFTDKSPLFDAIKTGILNCNGQHYCKVTDLKKEGLYELQRIDCNCNDCYFLQRDLSCLPDKGKPSPINYGNCQKFNKPVSFIPATCQIETQKCFIHRKDITSKPQDESR